MTEPDDYEIDMGTAKEGKGVLPAIMAIVALAAVLTWLVVYL